MNRKSQFDNISLGILSYLESNPLCSDIKFYAGDNLSSYELSYWEKKHQTKLPEDFKKFYLLFNSIKLIWTSNLSPKMKTIGEISLMKLEDVTKIPLSPYCNYLQDNILLSSSSSSRTASSSTSSGPAGSPFFDEYSRAMRAAVQITQKKENFSDPVFFVFDTCEYGRVGFLYYSSRHSDSYTFPTPAPPSTSSSSSSFFNISLLDQSGDLHFLCENFTQYLRLSMTHLGIKGWQLALTVHGLPLETQVWMNVFCKERLIVDRHSYSQSF